MATEGHKHYFLPKCETFGILVGLSLPSLHTLGTNQFPVAINARVSSARVEEEKDNYYIYDFDHLSDAD